ncbi:type II/IV secretion system protein [Methylobrevis sp. L22]|uniref:Type II/IV secretion system protein n=2 Tax=Methylobrevis albus TaxID=2793297 RepID=A0A931MZA8_9HYPH|nr:type II/IV secretion system protein [Methylobrevis albus]
MSGTGTTGEPAASRQAQRAGLGAELRRLGLVADDGRAGDADEPEALWRGGRIAATALADAIAAVHDLPRTSYDEAAAGRPLFQDLSRRFLREAFLYPHELDGTARLAAADPARADAIRAVGLALGRPLRLVVAGFDEIERLFERAAGEPTEAAPAAAASSDGETLAFSGSVDELKDLARGAPIVRTIDRMLESAFELGATDIHLETGRDELRVRFRIDGQLRPQATLPRAIAPAVISRVKILASLDIAERRLPQDGRANVRIGNAEADLRVAVAPTMYGETAVLRILPRDTRLLDFARIGMGAADQAAFRGLLAEPHGIIIVTGPTGSGKTTTLATAVSLLNDPARKIVTVEDPIEYQLPGVHQTQIKPAIGLDFASALRSFLRHDPDVIMVGEMRDGETAGIGIQAALTGHLVLTTLHTNTAADALVRLTDMGVEPFLIAASLRGVLGQRLVRRLCERCRRPDPTVRAGVEKLVEGRGLVCEPADVYYEPVGCEACGRTGYRGRIGVFEVLRMDDGMRSLLRVEPDPGKVLAAARAAGMTTMLEDGLAKAGLGHTSVEEVLRATG